MQSLTRDEAIERAALIRVRVYDLDIDLTTGPETFRVRTRIEFNCHRPGASTFVEHLVPKLLSATLNGADIDLERAYDDDRITLEGLAAQNELITVADAAYSPSLEGLQRAIDPEDGEVYIFSDAEPDFAQRVFACFDQPDLKAAFNVSVIAAPEWTVLANGAGTQTAPGRWRFATTPPLPTYLFALAAGPYHSVTSEHDGIPLGLHCRRSMAKYLDADELFDITRRGIDYYQPLFGARYPFDKYDQIFVPEMSGAMENAGLVTFDDAFLFRSPVTDDRRRVRAEVVLHELAHMWFGDLVTMRWWDDLWLNESFATYLAFRTLVDATRYEDAWTAFALGEKDWGYRQDALPTTHPISPDVPDSASAFLNMDGITYAKGAGVIKQLVAWVGVDAFDSGLRVYIAEHAFGNTTLADFLAALETSSGRALGPWAAEWLQTSGIATLWPRIDGDGQYRSVAVEQIAPLEQPTLRSHRIAVGLFDGDGDRLVRRTRLELDVSGATTPVPALVDEARPALLLLNDDDLTWAKVRLDPRSLEAVRLGAIPRIDEPLVRALLWMSVLDMARDAELSIGDALRIVLGGLSDTRDIGTTRLLLASTFDLIDRLGRPEHRETRRAELEARALKIVAAADPGSDTQLAFARASIDAATPGTGVERLKEWLAGRALPVGYAPNLELRWAMIARLAVLGQLTREDIDAECTVDLTTAGAEAGATARASLPTAAAKAESWQTLMAPDATSLGMRRSIARGFWRPEHLELTRPYLARYVEDAVELFARNSRTLAVSIAGRAFPTTLIEPETVNRVDLLLADDDLDPSFRRLLVEARHDLQRALRSREIDVSA